MTDAISLRHPADDSREPSGGKVRPTVTLLSRPPATHTIRLHRMWECLSEAIGPAEVVSSRIASGFSRIRWVRGFGQPSGLTRIDRVALVMSERPGIRRVTLNGTCLAEIPPTRELAFDVTDLLVTRNRLEIETTADQAGGGIREAAAGADHSTGRIGEPVANADLMSSFPGDVRLEIYRAYL